MALMSKLDKDGFKLIDIIYKESTKPKTQCFNRSIQPTN